MACLQPGAPPTFQPRTQYKYWTPDGGPPCGGKPPTPPQPSFGPGFQPPPFGAPPPYQQPPPSPLPPPHMCFPAAGGPPPPPQPGALWYQPKNPGMATAPALIPFCPPPLPTAYGGSSYPAPEQFGNPPAPGNRVNGEVVMTKDRKGYVTAEDCTTFHVLCPGQHFERMGRGGFQEGIHFQVQICDSEWRVKRLIERLGGLQHPRLPAGWHQGYAAIEQWYDLGDGVFQKGTCVPYLDTRANQTLNETWWGSGAGKAGERPPIWVVLNPEVEKAR